MPAFIPKMISNPSQLSHGRHPGFLLAIVEEQTPPDWQMAQKSPTMFRWQLAIWEHPDHVMQYAPEEQSGLTSTAFSPKGKFQASKCHVWTCALIGRDIPKGQGFDIDPLLPLSCWIDVERVPGNDFCKVKALYGRPEGQAAIPAVVHQLRAQYATGFPQAQGNGHAQPAAQQQTYQAPPAGQTAAQPQPQPQWGGPGPATQPGWPGTQGQQPAPQPQPQQPQLPGTAPRGAGAGVPF